MLAEEQDTIPNEPFWIAKCELDWIGKCFIRCLLSLNRTYLVGS